MRNKILRRIVQVTAFVAAAALQHGVHALQVTLVLPDCPAGQSLSFNASTNTLSCSGTPIVNAPLPGSCSVTAHPPSNPNSPLAPHTPVTLTASCATGNAGIRYHWSLGVQGESVTPSPSATITYVMTPENGAGQGTPVSTTVYITGAVAPTAPTGCSITQSPNTPLTGAVNVNQPMTLSLTCSGGSPVTSCAWSNGLGNTCTVQLNAPSQNTTYSVSAVNGGGSATAQTTVLVIPAPVTNTPTPPIAQNFCTGSDQIINLSYPDGGQIKPRSSGFGNQVIAYKFTVPTTFTRPMNPANIGFIRVAEVPGTSVTARDFTVSKHACDFREGNSDLLADGMGFGDTAPMVTFTVNNPTGYKGVGAFMNVNSGETFYFNIRNKLFGQPTCAFSSCDILLDVASPNRY